MLNLFIALLAVVMLNAIKQSVMALTTLLAILMIGVPYLKLLSLKKLIDYSCNNAPSSKNHTNKFERIFESDSLEGLTGSLRPLFLCWILTQFDDFIRIFYTRKD